MIQAVPGSVYRGHHSSEIKMRAAYQPNGTFAQVLHVLHQAIPTCIMYLFVAGLHR